MATKKDQGRGLHGFMSFIREQGVVGLAIGFILGGAVSRLVGSLVDNIINPLVGLGLGKVSLEDKALVLRQETASTEALVLNWGAVISTLIDFLIIAAVVYFGFKLLRLEGIDKNKN